ncbi:hypothetical protein BH23PLA1_BH23PLA1_09520 [soil metagenome]
MSTAAYRRVREVVRARSGGAFGAHLLGVIQSILILVGVLLV